MGKSKKWRQWLWPHDQRLAQFFNVGCTCDACKKRAGLQSHGHNCYLDVFWFPSHKHPCLHPLKFPLVNMEKEEEMKVQQIKASCRSSQLLLFTERRDRGKLVTVLLILLSPVLSEVCRDALSAGSNLSLPWSTWFCYSLGAFFWLLLQCFLKFPGCKMKHLPQMKELFH